MKNMIRACISTCIILMHCTMSPMDVIKTSSGKWRLKSPEEISLSFGKKDASPRLQKLMASVIGHYRKAGWSIPDTIWFKQMSPQAIEGLKAIGGRTPNMLNNGINMLHTTCDHEDLTKEECKQFIAHEVAHLTLRNHKWVNPHWYLNWYTAFPAMMTGTVLSPSALLIGICLAKQDPQVAKRFLLSGIIISAYTLSAHNLFHKARDSWRFAKRRENCTSLGIEYDTPWVKKVEETICDLLAASVMPEGGKHGASLWRKQLEHEGDCNGINGDHPWLSHRVAYHEAIQWMQDAASERT